MNTKRFLSILLVLAFYLSLPVYAVDYQLSNGNNFILSDAERVKETKPNTTVSFSKNDLIQSGVKAESIMIIELPNVNDGTLMFSKKQVTLYQEIPAGKLSKLKFVPTANTAAASFCYVVKTGGVLNKNVIRMTVKVPTEPKKQKLKVETQKNIGVYCYIDCLQNTEFDFTKNPSLGSISVSSNNQAIRYTPYENKVGTDTIAFNEVNESGDIVATHTINVKINKPASTIKYEDMSGSYAAYAAIKLAEAGVFTGNDIGGQLVFEPKKAVSRGDFLVMMMKSSETELNAASMSDTTFADYPVMPMWMKNYVGTAVQAGFISGKVDSLGNRYFDADAPLTRAEAAVITYNTFHPESNMDMSEVAKFSDSDSIPEWAMEAVYNLKACGILRGYEDNSFRATQTITREECASLLYSAMNYKSADSGVFGVFSFLNK